MLRQNLRELLSESNAKTCFAQRHGAHRELEKSKCISTVPAPFLYDFPIRLIIKQLLEKIFVLKFFSCLEFSVCYNTKRSK